jgi:hypothetical protein
VGKTGKRKGKAKHLMCLLGFTVLGYFVQQAVFPGGWFTALFVLVWFIVVVIWVLFLMPTRCHYDVGTHGCVRKVNGKLRGCWDHSQLKRDAVWAAMKHRNPGLAMRITWGDHRSDLGRQLGTNPVFSDRTAETGAYKTSMWWFTAVGSIAAVVAVLLTIALNK